MTNDDKNLGLIVIDSFHMMVEKSLDDYQIKFKRNIRDLDKLKINHFNFY